MKKNSLKKNEVVSKCWQNLIFLKLFLLTEQPTHKVGIIESRIPATMITSRELDVFHISTCLLQSPVCRTRTFRCNHIVSITMENTKLYRLSSFQARHIYCTANRHSSSKYLRNGQPCQRFPFLPWKVQRYRYVIYQPEALPDKYPANPSLSEKSELSVHSTASHSAEMIQDVPSMPNSPFRDTVVQARMPGISPGSPDSKHLSTMGQLPLIIITALLHHAEKAPKDTSHSFSYFPVAASDTARYLPEEIKISFWYVS